MSEIRDEVAKTILGFEARRDKKGRIAVYKLPAGDGGGSFEVAGINDRYHPHEASELARLIRQGRHAAAEERAAEYIAGYTDVAFLWTVVPAYEAYLRDCVFNRGARGAAKILQMALGNVTVDGIAGPKTRNALAAWSVAEDQSADFLARLRRAREAYERKVAKRDEKSPFWKGLVSRWNAALVMAKRYINPDPF